LTIFNKAYLTLKSISTNAIKRGVIATRVLEKEPMFSINVEF